MAYCKILMADDDPEDREIIGEAIDQLHHEKILCYAANGEEVLNLLESNDDQCSLCLIILDLNMPRLNGTQTLKALKQDERFSSIPVIIYSTSVNPMEKEKCINLGAHSYVIKPVSYKESLETAKSFLKFCGLSFPA